MFCINLISEEEREISFIHENSISLIRHYIDKRFNNKKDIIISCSNEDNRCKVWNMPNWECLHSIYIRFYGELTSICFSSIEDNFFIYASTGNNNEPIKYYDYTFKKEKILNNSKNETYYIEIFKDFKNNKEYLISCNHSQVNSYDIEKKILYKSFKDFNRNVRHLCAILVRINETTKLIESDEEGMINIWAFQMSILLEKINVSKNPINEILLWKDNYLISSDYSNLNLINIEEGKIIKRIKCDNKNELYSIEKIVLPQEGENLLIQNKSNEQIYMVKEIN